MLGQGSDCHERGRDSPVVQVNCFPIGVVARVETAPVNVELVAEDEVPLGAVLERGPSVGFFGRVGVDETKVA
jgi:hypothetical protein